MSVRSRQGGEEDSFAPSSKKRKIVDEEEDEEFTVEDMDDDSTMSPNASSAASRRKSKRRIKVKTIYDPGSPAAGGHKSSLGLSGGSSGVGLHASPVLPLSSSASYLPENNPSAIVESDMKDCFECLDEIMSQPKTFPFLEPVDWQSLGLHTYPQIVKIPMDLGTIKQMLLHNTLANPAHFAEHVRLVFKNAMDFNQPGSGIYVSAEELLAEFDAKYKQLCDRWLTQTPKESTSENPETQQQTEVNRQIEALQSNIEAVKQSIDGLKNQIEEAKQSRHKPKLRRIRLSTPKVPLTYAEKEDLCARITALSADDLPGLITIIQSASPNQSGGDDGEWEIDMSKIDDLTLLEVKKYVDGCNPPGKSGKRAGAGGRGRGRGRGPGGAPSTRKEPTNADIAKLAIAQSQTNQRMSDIQRQIQGVEKSKTLTIDRIVAVNPSDEREGFWIGRIAAIPENGSVQVEWYELKNRDSLDAFNAKSGGDVRYYEKSNSFDSISVHTIFTAVDVKLTWDNEKQLWVLNSAREIMTAAKRHDELDLHDLEMREAEAKMKAAAATT